MKRKNKKARKFSIYNETWRFPVLVAIGVPQQQALEIAKKKVGGNCELSDTCAGHTWINLDFGCAMIWFRESPSSGLLAHECLHVVEAMLSRAGLGKMSEETDEAYCYLLQWIIDQVEAKQK